MPCPPSAARRLLLLLHQSEVATPGFAPPCRPTGKISRRHMVDAFIKKEGKPHIMLLILWQLAAAVAVWMGALCSGMNAWLGGAMY